MHVKTKQSGAKRMRAAIERHNYVILCTHPSPDGDGVGCMIALHEYLQSIGKPTLAYTPDPIPDNFTQLDVNRTIKTFDPHQFEYDIKDFELSTTLLLMVDFGTLKRVKEITEFVVPRVGDYFILDHHVPHDEVDPEKIYVEPEVIATGELLAQWFIDEAIPISLTMARALYGAILVDSGSFRFTRTSSHTHRIAASLLEIGVEPDEIYSILYQQFHPNRMKILGKALQNLVFYAEQQFALFHITNEDVQALRLDKYDLENIVNMPLDTRSVCISAFLYDLPDGKTKVSFRSKHNHYSVQPLAQDLGGGGHIQAAGATLDMSLRESVSIVTQLTLKRYFPSFERKSV
jgi:bifunctional oligoribonuclease and PAP phosphatase NrnA